MSDKADEERHQLLSGAHGVQPRRIGLRHVVLALCMVCAALCYADRTNLSVALIAMRRQHDWPASTAGALLSAFFWGYLITQIPGGIFAARFGAKRTLSSGVLIWSALTIATPVCASISTSLLFTVRVCVGLAEGVAMPCLTALIAAWAPPLERSRSLALVACGGFVGTVSAYSCAGLVDLWWPGIFYLFGALGLVWALAFEFIVASTPAESALLSTAERLSLLSSNSAEEATTSDGDHPCRMRGVAHGSSKAAGSAACLGAPDGAKDVAEGALEHGPVPWGRLLRDPAFISICLAHFATNWGHYLLLTWLPSYLTSLGLRLDSAATLFATPYMAAIIVGNTGGWVADELLQRRLGWSVRTTRKAMQSVGHAMPALCFGLLCATSTAVTATGLLTVAISAASFSHSGYNASKLVTQ